MNVYTPYTSSLGPCWEAAWRLGRNNGATGVVVHSSRGRDNGGDGGWGWREDKWACVGALLRQRNSSRLLRVGFSGHAPVVNMLASVLREI